MMRVLFKPVVLAAAVAAFASSASARYISADPIGLAGGSYSLYGYVGGNPVSYIDPTGLECTTTNGTVTCNVPAGPQIKFPAPPGWPAHIKPGDTNYHYYNKQVNTGGIDRKCLEDYIRNHPTPGSPRPATAGGTANDATPSWASSFASSPVQSYSMTHEGKQVVVNVTMPGHPLFPGYVARTMTPSTIGTIADNYGEGTGWLQNPMVPFNDILINNVWYKLTAEAVKACTCK